MCRKYNHLSFALQEVDDSSPLNESTTTAEIPPKVSLWKHPKLRKLMLRAKISCALRDEQASAHKRQSLKLFAPFVPRGLHDYLIELAATHSQEEYPFGTTRQGAVLFADASGFTALTEQLATKVFVS